MAEKLIKPCGFCDTQQSFKRPSHLTEFGLPRLDMVPLIETDNTAVFTDILPVSPDGLHLLLVPKTHRQAFAQLDELRDEVGYAIHRVEEEFGVPLVRGEHGGGSPELGYGESKNQSVYHQHLHLFANPNGLDVLSYMRDTLKRREGIESRMVYGLDGTPVTPLKRYYTGHPYLFLQQGDHAIWAEDPGDTFPSQLLQRNISTLLNGEPLNWKQIPQNPGLARLSAQRIVQAFDACSYGK